MIYQPRVLGTDYYLCVLDLCDVDLVPNIRGRDRRLSSQRFRLCKFLQILRLVSIGTVQSTGLCRTR